MKKIIDKFNTPIHHEQIRVLYRQSPFLFLGVLSVMVVVTVFFWDRAEASILIGWLTLNLLLTFARIILVKSFYRVKPEGEKLVKWGLVFVLLATFSGILWGMIALLFMSPDDIESVFLISIVLTGMFSASLVALSIFLPAFWGFGLPALVPLTIIMLTQSEAVYVLIGYLVVAFLVANLGFSFFVNRNVMESIRLRFENLHLLKDLRKQKNIAEKANKDKSRFLVATSHDLRQPLHALDLYLGALKNLLSSDEQIQLLEKGQQSSLALSELLTALMDISRLDAGDIVVNRFVFDVAALMQKISEEYQGQAAQCGIVINVQQQLEGAVLVDSDPLMLGRMMRNLVNNACRHSAAKTIVLKVEKKSQQILISVCDDGNGIPLAAQQHIFSEFYQLNNPERDRSKGLGLGLATVKRLADLLQHDVQLESKEGEGSCFRLSLPCVENAAVTVSRADELQQMDIAGLFIILIDDEKEIRNAMRTLLQQWGCELIVADSLQSLQAELKTIQYPQPDVMLCDYRLREAQTGLDVVAAIRGYFNAPLPAIIISGDTDKVIAEKVIGSGCQILHKPIQPDVLRQEIYMAAGLRVADT